MFESVFPSRKRVRDKGGYICAITKLPAKYFDPITQLPYRDIQAFKILREAYYQQLDELGNVENPAVAKWIQWRKKVWIFNWFEVEFNLIDIFLLQNKENAIKSLWTN